MRVVRIVFVVLAASGGLGVALYGAYWIVLPPDPEAGRGRLPAWLEYAVAVAAALAAIWVAATSLPAGGLFAARRCWPASAAR